MSNNTKKLVFSSLIGSLYAVLTITLGFIGYGPIQFRVAEALCILPFLFPSTLPGLFIGCVAANLLSPYGLLDVMAGSLATLLAVSCTMLLGQIYTRRKDKNGGMIFKILACAPPVVFNAIIIGAVIAWFETNGGTAFLPAMMIYGIQVGFGELVVMYALGLPLLLALPKTGLYKMIVLSIGNTPARQKGAS